MDATPFAVAVAVRYMTQCTACASSLAPPSCTPAPIALVEFVQKRWASICHEAKVNGEARQRAVYERRAGRYVHKDSVRMSNGKLNKAGAGQSISFRGVLARTSSGLTNHCAPGTQLGPTLRAMTLQGQTLRALKLLDRNTCFRGHVKITIIVGPVLLVLVLLLLVLLVLPLLPWRCLYYHCLPCYCFPDTARPVAACPGAARPATTSLILYALALLAIELLASHPKPILTLPKATPSFAFPMSFFSLLEARVAAANTLLCVGLDPHRSELSVSAEATDQEVADAAFTFCKTLIDKTHEAAACYKPNAAFFEALGAPGHATLHAVIRAVPATIPVLLDCKRGDIGSTAEAYAIASYDKLDAHGVTLSPLMGYDSVAPFITGNYAERGGAFLLCKTSNPGSEDLLKANFENIARLATKWSKQASR